MVVCEKSYRRLLVSTWIGSMGRNGGGVRNFV
jgi:hypothetical protein